MTYTCKNDSSHTKTEEIPIDPNAHSHASNHTCEYCGKEVWKQEENEYQSDGNWHYTNIICAFDGEIIGRANVELHSHPESEIPRSITVDWG
jgi:hypothetical protein